MNRPSGTGMMAVCLFVILLIALAGRVNGQDNQVSVCRDPNYGATSFVVRIPDAWNDPTIPSWSVLAGGFGRYSDEPEFSNVYRADGLETVEIYGEGYPEWYKDIEVGNVLVFSGDYSTIAVGDETTPLCDDAGYPIPVPASTVVLDCRAKAVDSRTGQEYCYTAIASGVIPLPPAP